MLFAPAIGIACLEVLGWLCLLVAALAFAVVVKQAVVQDPGPPVGVMLGMMAGFAAAGFGCRWGSRKIARAAGH